MNTKVDTVLGECESIISSVEDVYFMTESNDFVTNLLETEEFENLRYIAEYMQSFVLTAEEKGVDFTTLDEFETVSVTMYQEIKYLSEAVEEITTNKEILNELGYIRAAVNIIRNMSVVV